MTSKQALVWVCLSAGAGRGRLKGRKRKSTGYSALSQPSRARRNLLSILYLSSSWQVLIYDGKREGDKSLRSICFVPDTMMLGNRRRGLHAAPQKTEAWRGSDAQSNTGQNQGFSSSLLHSKAHFPSLYVYPHSRQ